MNCKLILLVQCVISVCLCELSIERKEKLLNDFVVYYNNLPNELYTCDEGVLNNAQQIDDNTYKIEVNLKVSAIDKLDSTKYLTCTATVQDSQHNIKVLDNDLKCEVQHNIEESVAAIDQPTGGQVEVTDPTVESKPVRLDNEIQANAAATSGEQFIAIRRERPSTPCVGCSTHVNPQAAGVSDLVSLGIRHLDKHEPTVRHRLDTILDVERQVQVVNGVRYILTLLINFNNCTDSETDACASTRACKISVLDKPWVKLPNGAKYRAILANNCTEEWQYGDNGEVLPEDSDDNRAHNEIDNHPSKDDGRNGDIKVIHIPDVQSLPNQEKILTEEQVKDIEEQIIPSNQFEEVPPKNENHEVITASPDSDLSKLRVVKDESVIHNSKHAVPFTENSEHNTKPEHTSQDKNSLSQDKKQAIDDMLSFFEISGFKPNSEVEPAKPRMKRSYDFDLQVLSLAETYQDIKKRLENAKFVYTVAQEMIDYLNEMDMTVKDRYLKMVLNAEEEFQNYQHFVYIQALVTIPCSKAECKPDDTITRICNGVIDCTNKDAHQILNTFCHKDHKEISEIGNEIPADDLVLENLVKTALKKIESESSSEHAMRLNKVISANTRQASGTLTKISIKIDYIDCNKSVPYLLKKKCTVLEKLGSKICEVIIHERHWLKEKKVSYTCTDVPIDVSMSKETIMSENQTSDDPKIREMLRESLQHLEIQSNRNNKQKIVKINSVTSQITAGFLTKIEFLVGYTTCSNEYALNKPSKVCELLPNERLRKCLAQFWDRSWIEDGRQMEVACDDDLNNNNKELKTNNSDKATEKRRKKRSQQKPGGQSEQNVNDPKYRALALESLQKFMKTSSSPQHYDVIQINRVTIQVVSGNLYRIYFKISPTNCQVGNDGAPTSSSCDIINSEETYDCTTEVLEQAWLNNREITVTCHVNDGLARSKRSGALVGGPMAQNSKDQKYIHLAEESLKKYVATSGVSDSTSLQLLRVDEVTTQVVAGILTNLNFTISYKGHSDNIKCHSRVWEKPWEHFTDINVTCNMEDHQHSRTKRQANDLTECDPSDPKYKALAEHSLQKYMQNKENSQSLKFIRVDNVTIQVVEGLITRIDFVTADSETSEHIKCHSTIWDQAWRKDINVQCNIKEGNSIVKREIFRGTEKARHILKNNKRVQNPKDKQYHSLAEESLREYERLKNNGVNHKVIEVKHVATQVVSGMIYVIDYTATPTTCTANTASVNCTNMIMYCHTKIWSQLWMRLKEIDVSCYSDNESDNDDEYDDNDANRNFKIHKNSRRLLGAPEAKNVDTPIYKNLADEALKKYSTQSNVKLIHKVTKIHSVTEQVVEGKLTKINFSISPTTCLREEARENENGCEVKIPQVDLLCTAEVWDRPWLNDKDINVDCERSEQEKHLKPITKLREKRQAPNEDDYVDDEMKYYYANRAVQHVNEQTRGGHLHKLVTIHAVQYSVQMKTTMVRMYIELAETFCLRHQDELELPNCEEMDGQNHKLCLARLWPSPDDELVVRHISVICDDEDDFESISGLHISDLLIMSINEFEKKPEVKFKTVHQGEPHIVPSLDSKTPIVLNFLLATTNCSKNVNLTNSLFGCYIDVSLPTKSCTSYIWLMPNGKSIKTMTVSCSSPTSRTKRSSDVTNTTTDDIELQKLITAALEKLEMESLQRYKQRVLQINSHSTKITSGKVTTIDFDVGYTACLKYEWVENVTSCDFLEHLPRRHCVAQIWERLWLNNGRNIDVRCEDDETPLEAHIEFESAGMAMELARGALKHIEAKYPHPKKQKVVRIFSLEKQVIAGIHYRMKIEVALTDCMALSERSDCKIVENLGINKFCRVNVWIRPWTAHPPNYRVSCDYQDGTTTELYRNIQAEYLFYDFITTNNPSYVNDHNEMRKRFEIFKANVRKIHELNIYEMGTARYGISRFADLTYDEFRTKYTGLKPSLRNPNKIPMGMARIPHSKIPERFDWRDYDAVTDVKDQGSCGSCWAFSVTGNVEGQWKMQSGQLVSLSEQELVDCDKMDEGCNGGLMDNAYRAIEELGGLEAERDYPYEGEDDKCVYNKTLSKVQISGAVNISSNETEMAMWLLHNGPISIGINANAMQFYMGGISHPWKALCSPTNLDHGVLIVGYGVKDYPLFNKHLPYWTVKNSWGTSWGEQGYYRVYRGDGTCGVNQMASSAVI